MLKESAASSQSLADGLVLLIHQFQDRVHQEGQQVERKEQGRQVLLAMSEVVLDMIALGLRTLLFSFSTFQRVRPSRAMASTLVSSTSKSVMKAFR